MSNFPLHFVRYGCRSNSLYYLIEIIVGLSSNMSSLVLLVSMHLLLWLELLMLSIGSFHEHVVVSLMKGLLIIVVVDIVVEVAQVGAWRSLLLYLRLMMAKISSNQV